MIMVMNLGIMNCRPIRTLNCNDGRLDNQVHCFTATKALIKYVNTAAFETDADVSMVSLAQQSYGL